MRLALVTRRREGGGASPPPPPPPPPPSATTWNPADKHPTIALSGGDLIAAATEGAWRSVRGTIGRSSGAHSWSGAISVSDQAALGFASASDPMSSIPGLNASGIQLFYNGLVCSNGAVVGTIFTFGPGDAITCTMVGHGTATFAKNGGAASAPFAADGISGAYYPVVSLLTSAAVSADFAGW